MPHYFDFVFTPDELANSPSRRDGIEEEVEYRLRVFGTELIQDASILLKLPQVAAARACVLFHRFYQRQSFRQHDVKSMAMASTFVASKLEEQPRKSQHIINVFHHLLARKSTSYQQQKSSTSSSQSYARLSQSSTPSSPSISQLGSPTRNPDVVSIPSSSSSIPPLMPLGDRFNKLREELFESERWLLKELGFVLSVDHPHKYILVYVRILRGDQQLAQKAWSLLNDSLRTDVCVRYRAEVIASGAIYLAARFLSLPLPESPPWWELFDTTKDEVQDVCQRILHLYALPPAYYVNVLNPGVTTETNLSMYISGYTAGAGARSASPMSVYSASPSPPYIPSSREGPSSLTPVLPAASPNVEMNAIPALPLPLPAVASAASPEIIVYEMKSQPSPIMQPAAEKPKEVEKKSGRERERESRKRRSPSRSPSTSRSRSRSRSRDRERDRDKHGHRSHRHYHRSSHHDEEKRSRKHSPRRDRDRDRDDDGHRRR